MRGTASAAKEFDDVLGTQGPEKAELLFKEWATPSLSNSDTSTYLQILSQLALAQAMQQKFAEALATLDQAETVSGDFPLARARLLLERGRLHHQKSLFAGLCPELAERELGQARKLFEASFELCQAQGLDAHATNAAHMLGIAAPSPTEKIRWNQLALQAAESSQDTKAKAWTIALYNNLAHNHLEAGDYAGALHLFERALELRIAEGILLHIRMARWAKAHTLRLLGRLEEAKDQLLGLAQEYEDLPQEEKQILPEEALCTARGFVYEDLAQIPSLEAKSYAKKALADLSKAPWIRLDAYRARWELLKTLAGE